MSRHEYQWARTKGKESAEDHSEETRIKLRPQGDIDKQSDGGRGQGTSETPGSSHHANGPSVLQEYKQAQKNRSGGKKKPKQVCEKRLFGRIKAKSLLFFGNFRILNICNYL